MRARLIAAALSCACASVFAAGAAGAADKPVTHTVVIEGMKFHPQTLDAKRGDTIVWINRDPFPHSATAPGTFDSHAIAAGRSWKYAARKAGEYAYVCTLHSNMSATLRVK